MKKIIILLSLIATTVLLTSCGSFNDFYGEEKYGDWTSSTTE
jgi:hypothetical protein